MCVGAGFYPAHGRGRALPLRKDTDCHRAAALTGRCGHRPLRNHKKCGHAGRTESSAPTHIQYIPTNFPSKSQQFPAKFCAPLQNAKILPETVADGLRKCYAYTINRKYTIYGHPWVSRFAAFGGKADSVFAKSKLKWRGS